MGVMDRQLVNIYSLLGYKFSAFFLQNYTYYIWFYFEHKKF